MRIEKCQVACVCVCACGRLDGMRWGWDARNKVDGDAPGRNENFMQYLIKVSTIYSGGFDSREYDGWIMCGLGFMNGGSEITREIRTSQV